MVQDKYEYIKQIGHGAYGVVCSAFDHSIKAKVAIKKIPKAFEDLIDAKRIVREIKLLSKFILTHQLFNLPKKWLFYSILFHIEFFDHENIVGLVDVQKPPSQVGYEDIYIITDLMETDMHRVIYSRQDLTDDHC